MHTEEVYAQDVILGKLFSEARWHRERLGEFDFVDDSKSLSEFIDVCEESLKADKALAEFLKTHMFKDEELFIADMKCELASMKEKENAGNGV